MNATAAGRAVGGCPSVTSAAVPAEDLTEHRRHVKERLPRAESLAQVNPARARAKAPPPKLQITALSGTRRCLTAARPAPPAPAHAASAGCCVGACCRAWLTPFSAGWPNTSA